MNNIKPIYGQGTFVVCSDGTITQEIIFDYIDSNTYYWNLLSDELKFNMELNKLMNNMQSFLDNEEVKINGKIVYPKVIGIDIGFRGSPETPYIAFYISFKGELRRGINYYENIYEPEVVEYDYCVTWIFTGGLKVIKANVGVAYDIIADGRMLMFSMHKNSLTPGYERIEFLR